MPGSGMKLTPEERAAIEAFTGDVKQIPTGKSGLHELRFCKRRNGLFPINAEGRFLTKSESMRHGRTIFRGPRKVHFNQQAEKKPATPEEILRAKRYEFIRENYQTMGVMEMCKALGCDRSVVRRALNKWGVKANGRYRSPEQVRAEVAEAMANGAKTITEVARACRLRNVTARDIMKSLT